MMKATYHLSRGSGKERCTLIISDIYWLKAFLSQPSSTSFLISPVKLVESVTGLPISPGRVTPLPGTAKTPSTSFYKNKQKKLSNMLLLLLNKK